MVGVAIAADLVDAARTIGQTQGLDIRYEIGDAEALRFEDASFDAVVSTFGVMFASRPEVAAAEIARVVRPGGRIALTTWAPDSNVFEMFKVMKTFMSAPPSPPPSPFDWGRRERVVEMLGAHFELGFETSQTIYHAHDGNEVWETASLEMAELLRAVRAIDKRTRVLVVGAGPVGLATAIELGHRGIDCPIVERNDRVGYASSRSYWSTPVSALTC